MVCFPGRTLSAAPEPAYCYLMLGLSADEPDLGGPLCYLEFGLGLVGLRLHSLISESPFLI